MAGRFVLNLREGNYRSNEKTHISPTKYFARKKYKGKNLQDEERELV
jgi:hypothetical protein